MIRLRAPAFSTSAAMRASIILSSFLTTAQAWNGTPASSKYLASVATCAGPLTAYLDLSYFDIHSTPSCVFMATARPCSRSFGATTLGSASAFHCQTQTMCLGSLALALTVLLPRARAASPALAVTEPASKRRRLIGEGCAIAWKFTLPLHKHYQTPVNLGQTWFNTLLGKL